MVELYEAEAGRLDPREVLFGSTNRTVSAFAPPSLEVRERKGVGKEERKE